MGYVFCGFPPRVVCHCSSPSLFLLPPNSITLSFGLSGFVFLHVLTAAWLAPSPGYTFSESLVDFDLNLVRLSSYWISCVQRPLAHVPDARFMRRQMIVYSNGEL